MLNQKTIAFIGAGNMASAIIGGLLNNGMPADHIWASSPHIAEKSHLAAKNIHTTTNNIEAAAHADIVVLSVKPHLIADICHQLKATINDKDCLVISIAAGTSIKTIADTFQTDTPIIRAMPNIAAAVSASATTLFANTQASKEQKTTAESLFRSVGTVFWSEVEDKLNAFTAIAGSGPAYLFYVFEALQDAAEQIGIDKDTAKLLIAETAIGAAKMALESSEDFVKLREFVTSPKGTTAAATDVLTNHHVKESFIKAVEAAFEKAKELSQ